MRRRPYRFAHRKGRPIQVMFDHIPNKWISTGTNDDGEAIAFAEERLRKDLGRVQTQDMTLRDFAKGFFTKEDPKGFRKRQEARGAHNDDAWYAKKDGHMRNYILPAHGDYLLSGISDVLIEDFILDIPLSGDSKNKILLTYSDVMREAKRQGYISENPCDHVKPVVYHQNERKPFTEEELSVLFPEDHDKLVWIWGTVQWALYFMIQKDTGWRPSEVSALSVDNWYPELRGIVTTRSVDYRTHQIKDSIKTTKKGQKFKEGFLSDQTAQLLGEYIIKHPERRDFFRMYPKSIYIYPDAANKHLIGSAKRAGVDLNGRTQYSFRHSWQTYYIGRMPELARLLLMGHTHTRQEYSHLTPEQTLQRVLSIDGVKEVLEEKR